MLAPVSRRWRRTKRQRRLGRGAGRTLRGRTSEAARRGGPTLTCSTAGRRRTAPADPRPLSTLPRRFERRLPTPPPSTSPRRRAERTTGAGRGAARPLGQLHHHDRREHEPRAEQLHARQRLAERRRRQPDGDDRLERGEDRRRRRADPLEPREERDHGGDGGDERDRGQPAPALGGEAELRPARGERDEQEGRRRAGADERGERERRRAREHLVADEDVRRVGERGAEPHRHAERVDGPAAGAREHEHGARRRGDQREHAPPGRPLAAAAAPRRRARTPGTCRGRARAARRPSARARGRRGRPASRSRPRPWPAPRAPPAARARAARPWRTPAGAARRRPSRSGRAAGRRP